MRVTKKMIEEAVEQTRERWVPISEASGLGAVHRAMGNSCGFCTLSNIVQRQTGTFRGCILGTCPIQDETDGCCAAWEAYDERKSMTTIRKEAKKLLARMDDFDIPEIVRTINKAIKKWKEEEKC